MGRLYKNELRSLPVAYDWAVANRGDRLEQLWADQSNMTLIACGSGGSYSAASVAVALHRNYHGAPGYAVTPLEMVVSVPRKQACSLWFFSGSGTNLDIRRAMRRASIHEDNELTIFCTRKNSPLERDARKKMIERIFSFDANTGKDGFLATNTLFVSAIMLAKSFDLLPRSLNTLIQTVLANECSEEDLRDRLLSAAQGRSNAIILHGPCGRAGAIDLESRFTESALITSSVSDFRNFAHGRHNWINRFGSECFVIALIGHDEKDLASQTLALIPKHVPSVSIPLGRNFAAAQVLSIYFSIQIVGWLGERIGIDPGRPIIPEFGRRLYHLRTRLVDSEARISVRQASILRKVSALGAQENRDVASSYWSKKYSTFRNRINSNKICAIAFDYDGTLVATNARSEPPIPIIAQRLVEILQADVPIGIATGRGDSVRQALLSIIPSNLHTRVLIGYLNASQIVRMDVVPEVSGDFSDPILDEMWAKIRSIPNFSERIAIKKYPEQISVQLVEDTQMARLWTAFQTLVAEIADDKLKVLVSGHSLDIMLKGVSKSALVSDMCREFTVAESQVLRFGDNGCWPGNDWELLRSPLGLSVGQVSADPDTCWNLLPTRCTGVNGTLYYLDRVHPLDGMARIRL